MTKEAAHMPMRSTIRTILVVCVLILLAVQPGCRRSLAVLYFTDSDNDFAGEALDRMGFAYTRTYSLTDFAGAFVADAWDIVIVDNRHPVIPEGMFEAVATLMYYYHSAGGKILLSTCYLDNDEFEAYWATFGYQHQYSSPFPINVFRLESAGDLWTDPNDVPDLDLTGVTDTYGNAANAFKGSAVMSGSKVATFNEAVPGDPNSGAVFKANSGRTILNAFFLDDAVVGGVPIDSDDDNIPDAVEWYMNELAALEKVPGAKVKPAPP